MSLKLEQVVPWGRSLPEYVAMFDLSAEDLGRRILDCGGGPSSFTTELTAQSGQAISIDPLYAFSADEIRSRIDETYHRILELNRAHRENFLWHTYGSPEALGQVRLQAMERFLADFPTGQARGRYRIGELPALPIEPGSFDLALCSHFLFTYSEQFTTEFHLNAILDMARIASEVRVFPILTAFSGEVSPHLAPVTESLRAQGYEVEVREVNYEFQKGGNRMLRITH